MCWQRLSNFRLLVDYTTLRLGSTGTRGSKETRATYGISMKLIIVYNCIQYSSWKEEERVPLNTTEDTYVILSRLNSFWSTALRLTGNTRHWTQMQTLEAELVQFNDLMHKIKSTKAYKLVRQSRIKTR